jgi:predicted enzyme related to lactoylglutathione lyase
MASANPVVWFEVRGAEADKLRGFYGELLGWEFDVDGDGYGMIAGADPEQGPGGGIGPTAPGQRGWTAFYVQVPNLEVAVGEAQALGSTVLLPPTQLPETTIAVVSDPEGRALGLCAPRSDS